MTGPDGHTGPAAGSLRISIRRGDTAIGMLTPADRPITLGRSARCDVVLDDPAVSRAHAVLSLQAGEWLLVDQQSRNGLWVGGRRVPKVTLAPGVSAAVGPFLLVVEFGAGTAAVESEGSIETRDAREDAASRDA